MWSEAFPNYEERMAVITNMALLHFYSDPVLFLVPLE